MVAPIALFPDKLVALVLAGSTYPDQIAAANTWLAQNPDLKGQALATSGADSVYDATRLRGASNEKAKAVLGWSPERPELETMIEDAWGFLQSRPA